MNDLFEQFNKDEHAGYSPVFESLVDSYAPTKGSGEKGKRVQGKAFNSKYEFYIYCFFIGFYSRRRFEVNKSDRKTFWQFKQWPKHTYLKEVIFVLLMDELIDELKQLEEMSDDETKALINSMFSLMEEYANGGMEYLKERRNNEADYFSNPFWPKELLEECSSWYNKTYFKDSEKINTNAVMEVKNRA